MQRLELGERCHPSSGATGWCLQRASSPAIAPVAILRPSRLLCQAGRRVCGEGHGGGCGIVVWTRVWMRRRPGSALHGSTSVILAAVLVVNVTKGGLPVARPHDTGHHRHQRQRRLPVGFVFRKSDNQAWLFTEVTGSGALAADAADGTAPPGSPRTGCPYLRVEGGAQGCGPSSGGPSRRSA